MDRASDRVGAGRVGGRAGIWITSITLFVALCTAFPTIAEPPATAPAAPPPPKAFGTGSRSRNVHRIGLYFAPEKQVTPDAQGIAEAMSVTQTCRRCHNVDQDANGAHRGWHFNAIDPNVSPGRPGEPWILADRELQIQIPLSLRNWPGTFRPQDVGLTDVKFLKAFGGQMPGGGVGNPPAGAQLPEGFADPKAKWAETGRNEINCFICHLNTNLHEDNEYSRAITGGKYQEAVVVALGLGKPAPANTPPTTQGAGEAPIQKMTYDKARFDENNRVFFDIVRNPPAERCYYCHTSHQVGPAAPADFQFDGDIHMRASMRCADCHRHDMRHNVMRGYEGEPAAEHGGTTLTCRNCHLGDPNAPTIAAVLGGRLAAPHPEHKGLPPVHFEKLTCTVCHSGPYPEQEAKAFQTSMAHKLGIAPRTRPDDDWPLITGPIFVKQSLPDVPPEQQKLAPHRVVWPQYWGWQGKDGKIAPAKPDDIKSSVKAGRRAAKLKADDALTDAATAAVLADMAKKDPAKGEPVYVDHGKLYTRSGTDGISGVGHPAAAAYAWAIGHDVRPAAQSLGVRGCTDCHAASGVVNAGHLASPVDPKASLLTISTQSQLRGEDQKLIGFWAWSFQMRSMFKVFAYVATALLALLLLRYAFLGLGGLLRRTDER